MAPCGSLGLGTSRSTWAISFESYDFGCTVTIDHSDLGYTDEEARDIGLDQLVAELTDQCMGVLNDQLAEEIREAAHLTAADKSFLLDSFTTRKGKRR